MGELRAWFTEWAREAQRSRAILEGVVEILEAVKRDVHVVAAGVQLRRAEETAEGEEDGSGPAQARDTEGVIVPACRICGCTWESIHNLDDEVAAGPSYHETNCYVESDLCVRCRDLAEDDATRRAELRLRLEAAGEFVTTGQRHFGFVGSVEDGGAS